MIERTNAFKVGDQSFLTLADAQKYELKELWTKSVGSSSNTTDSVVDWVITNRIKILDILTTTNASKPKARKINGGSKPRRIVVPKTEDKTWSPLTPMAVDDNK